MSGLYPAACRGGSPRGLLRRLIADRWARGEFRASTAPAPPPDRPISAEAAPAVTDRQKKGEVWRCTAHGVR